MHSKWMSAVVASLCAAAIGCGADDERQIPADSGAPEAAPGAASGSESGGADASGAESGGVDGTVAAGAGAATGVDGEALRRCLLSLEGAITVETVDDKDLQRRLLAAGQSAYAIRPKTEDDKETFFSVYVFGSAPEAQAEHKRRLQVPESEFEPQAGSVGDDDLVAGPVLLSDVGDGDGLFDSEATQCAQGAVRS